MKKLFIKGVWQDEFGCPIPEPKSYLDQSLSNFPSILSGGHYDDIGKEIGKEIDNHNMKKEKEEQAKDLGELENVTKSFLKTNNLL